VSFKDRNNLMGDMEIDVTRRDRSRQTVDPAVSMDGWDDDEQYN
jgi:hypothetical protein